MAGTDNADANWSEIKIEEEEDSLRTVDCLRGRLLAERLASRNARKEAEQLGNKLVEMEKLLKEEARSRNRAEKKLKLLIKRLESMDIVQEIKDNVESPKGSSANLPENDSQISLWNLFDDSSAIEGSSSSNEQPVSSAVAEDCLSSADCDKPFHLDDIQMCDDSTTNNKRMKSSCEEGVIDEDNEDKSMAIIAIEMRFKEKERIDPKVVDASVKEVLESLKRAKEQLQTSMERKRMSTNMSMIKVG